MLTEHEDIIEVNSSFLYQNKLVYKNIHNIKICYLI